MTRWFRVAAGAIVGLAAAIYTLTACELDWDPGSNPSSNEAETGVIVGNISLSRDEMDPQRYVLSLQVLNRRSTVLEELTLVATVDAATPDENQPHLSTRIRILLKTSVGPDVRQSVEVSMESPFSVVPPGPLTLSDIRIGAFVFAADAGEPVREDTWIEYFWPVEEHS